MSLLKQPKILWVIITGELWGTFSYFGTQTILVLYFMHVFRLGSSDSYALYGAYAAFAYGLPILGGIVADKWLGNKNAVMLGGTLNILGNGLLILSSHYAFCLGLAVSLVGSAVYKSSSTCLVGTLYDTASIQKERGFTLLYLAANIGGVLGPLVYGIIIYALGWHFVFLGSALGIFAALLWFIANKHLLQHENQLKLLAPTVKILLFPAIVVTCLLLSVPFYIPSICHVVIIALFILGVSYLLAAIIKYKDSERSRLLALLILSFFAMFYFAAGLQIGASITLFIQADIHKGIIKTAFPASTFSTLYPLFVLLLAPLFTYLWSHLKERSIVITVPSKVLLGMLFAAIGIGLFAVAALTHFTWFGIIVGILMLSAGELILTPAIYMAISDLSPVGMKSTMMGCWFLFIAMGGYLSGVLVQSAHPVMTLIRLNNSLCVEQFIFIAGVTFIAAIALMVLTPHLLKRMR